MNSRRKSLIALGVVTVSLPRLAFAQASKPPVLIGWLNSQSRRRESDSLAAFKDAMAGLGWKDGGNYVLEERWADGQVDRLPGLAEELAARKPALIVAATARATIASAKAD